MDKIRLLLRSVYLKGHQDENLKTSDMSWEDKIIKDIDALYKERYLGMLPEERATTVSKYDENEQQGYLVENCEAVGFNSAIQEMKRRVG